MSRPTSKTIDDYIAGFPPQTQAALREIRGLIRAAAPDATETFSYAIPTFDMNGHHLVHFAGYDRHVGFYPTGRGMDVFRDEFKQYKTGKGSVQFPIGTPLPAELITRVVASRVADAKCAPGLSTSKTRSD